MGADGESGSLETRGSRRIAEEFRGGKAGNEREESGHAEEQAAEDETKRQSVAVATEEDGEGETVEEREESGHAEEQAAEECEKSREGESETATVMSPSSKPFFLAILRA